ncbi:hypothetical protein VCHA35O135_80003 [Vibrio chagasii]|nr:hypothetical protein VCHA35O135_80003 [Vibrio chagasii]
MDPKSRGNYEIPVELYAEMKHDWLKFQTVLKLCSWPSLVGIFIALWLGNEQLDKIIKEAVVERVKILDNLPIAISLGENGNWQGAFLLLSGMWDDVIENNRVESTDFKDQYYNNLLWVMSAEPNFEGETNKLLKLYWFKMNNKVSYWEYRKRYSEDFNVLMNATMASMKYDFKIDQFVNYVSKIESAYDGAKESSMRLEVAEYAYFLAILNVIQGNNDIAQDFLIEAHKLHPSEFRLHDWKEYKASYFNDPAYDFFRYVAKKMGVKKLENKHESVVEAALKKLTD